MLTDIFGIELVNANQHTDGRSPQNPGESWTEFRELAWVYVVHQEVVKLDSSNGPPRERRASVISWSMVKRRAVFVSLWSVESTKGGHTPMWLCMTKETPKTPSKTG